MVVETIDGSVVVGDGATVGVVVGSVAGAIEAVVAGTAVLIGGGVEDVGVTSGTAAERVAVVGATAGDERRQPDEQGRLPHASSLTVVIRSIRPFGRPSTGFASRLPVRIKCAGSRSLCDYEIRFSSVLRRREGSPCVRS